jgi:ABC-type Fe3+-siderophore transport system permease subunit
MTKNPMLKTKIQYSVIRSIVFLIAIALLVTIFIFPSVAQVITTIETGKRIANTLGIDNDLLKKCQFKTSEILTNFLLA